MRSSAAPASPRPLLLEGPPPPQRAKTRGRGIRCVLVDIACNCDSYLFFSFYLTKLIRLSLFLIKVIMLCGPPGTGKVSLFTI